MKLKLLFALLCFPIFAFAQTGTFSVALTTTDSLVYDTPGAFMSVHGTIYNLSTTDSAELSIEKQFIDIPGTWETALCTDVCYPSSVNYIVLSIPPADSQEFVFYFYTDLVADSGYARVLYTNLNVPGNTVLQSYHGITQNSVGVSEAEKAQYSLYPNPAVDFIYVRRPDSLSEDSYEIMDLSGKLVMKGIWTDGESILPVSALKRGTYLLRTAGSDHVGIRFVKQ